MKLTAVILTVDPSHLFPDCLRAVEAQSRPADQLEVVRNVSPVGEAIRRGFESVNSDLVVFVDEDMILERECFAQMVSIHESNSGCAELVCGLRDPLVGRVMGIHMFKAAVLREVGVHGDNHTDEWRAITARVLAAGYEVLHEWRTVVGEHHPRYTPEEAYWKFKMRGEKCRFYPADGFREASIALQKLSDYWLLVKDPVAFYAIAGLMDGLRADDVAKTLTYEGRSEAPGYLKMREGLRSLGGYEPEREVGAGLSDEEKKRRIVQNALKRVGENQILTFISLSLIGRNLLGRMMRWIGKVMKLTPKGQKR